MHPKPLGYVPLVGLTQDEADILDAFTPDSGADINSLSARLLEALIHRDYVDPDTWGLTPEGKAFVEWLRARE